MIEINLPLCQHCRHGNHEIPQDSTSSSDDYDCVCPCHGAEGNSEPYAGFVSVGGLIIDMEWLEYDNAAMDLARKGLTGAIGDPLPNLMSSGAVALINDDPEAFQLRVRQNAYAIAMKDIPNNA